MNAILKKPAAGKGDNSLDAIARQILAIERKSISNIIETGRLLEEAFKQCDRGTFEDWSIDKFGWSVRTVRRYRDAYKFSLSANLAELNLSVSALHVLVSCGPKKAARIMGAGIIGRISYSNAIDICKAVDAGDADADAGDAAAADDDDSDDGDAAGDAGDDHIDDDDAQGDEKRRVFSGDQRYALALVTNLRVLCETLLATPLPVDICQVADEVGWDEWRGLAGLLTSVVNKHDAENAVKAAADRTEATAKAKRGEKIPAPAASDDNASAAWKATKAAAPADYPDLPPILDRKLH